MAVSTKKKFGLDVYMTNVETLSIRAIERSLPDAPEVSVVNLAFGVNLYKNILDADTCSEYIKILDRELDGSKPYSWLPVEPDQTLRNAVDFQITEDNLGIECEETKDLYELNRSVLAAIKQGIDDYSKSWNISIEHYESLNFVKYSHPDSYFKPHIDDSPDRPRIVSAVLYLNSDYDGGQLRFTRLDNLTIKPEPGDLIVFPSSYLYMHESKPVLSGSKYSVVVCTDYKKRA